MPVRSGNQLVGYDSKHGDVPSASGEKFRSIEKKVFQVRVESSFIGYGRARALQFSV